MGKENHEPGSNECKEAKNDDKKVQQNKEQRKRTKLCGRLCLRFEKKDKREEQERPSSYYPETFKFQKLAIGECRSMRFQKAKTKDEDFAPPKGKLITPKEPANIGSQRRPRAFQSQPIFPNKSKSMLKQGKQKTGDGQEFQRGGKFHNLLGEKETPIRSCR